MSQLNDNCVDSTHPVCPHCGHEDYHWCLLNNSRATDTECPHCDEVYHVSEYRSYTTTKPYKGSALEAAP